MPIGVEGQFLASINDEELDSGEVQEFQIRDQVGLGLPTFEMLFKTDSKEKMREFTRIGKEIEIGFGKDRIESFSKFKVFKKICNAGVTGAHEWTIRLWAVLDSVKYLEEQRVQAYNSMGDKLSSDKVWSLIARRHGFVPETVDFNDQMLWLQYNLTDRQFLQEVTWHGYYQDNEPCLPAITRDYRAIYKPMSELRKVKGIVGDTDACDYLTNTYEFTQNEGFLGAWGGGSRIAPFFNIEEGAVDENWAQVSQQILGKGLREDALRVSEFSLMGDNVHKNWVKANEQNRILRASLNSFSMSLNFAEYYELYPLDYVKVDWYEKVGEEAIEAIHGEWLITATRLIMNANSFEQYVVLNREGLL